MSTSTHSTVQRRTPRRFAALTGTALILSSLLMTFAATGVGATAAPQPGYASTQVGEDEWTDAAEAFGSTNDDTYATTSVANADEGYGGFGGFGMGTKPGSIINGITVTIDAKATDDSNCDLAVRLSGDAGGSFTGYKTADLTATETQLVFGSSSDTWGHVWDPPQLSNANFRLEIRNINGNDCDNASVTSVDWIKVDVDYTQIDEGGTNDPLSSEVCDQADFNFVIDMSGSIGAQGSAASNLPDLIAGINGFVTAFEANGDGIYSGTRFSGTTATDITGGAYVDDATFHTAIDALSGPAGTTPTAAGINTAVNNDAGDRPGVQNILFVVTDGSPNVPPAGGNLALPETWLEGANAAIAAADAARSDYVVKAVYLVGLNDPGDTTLPFSNPAGDAQWASAVMTEIGGGSFLPGNFGGFVDELFDAIGCTPPSQTSITTDASGSVNLGGSISDIATLSGGTDPTGTITFNLYGPNDATCAGAVIFTSNKPVDGNGAYASDSFAPVAVGVYRWIASYSGDDHNTPASGACNDADEWVLITQPNIDVTKLVATGDDDFGPTSQAQPGDVLNFQITIHNAGDGPATNVAVEDNINSVLTHATYNDDCGSCTEAGGILSWTIASIAGGATEVLTFSVTLDASFPDGTTHLPNVVVVQGPGSNCAQTPDEDCDTDTTVSEFLLTIDKDNDATPESQPTAEEGATVTYTLAYDVGALPVSKGEINDVLPAGIEYVANSATNSGEFIFDGYNPATRTLTWLAEDVTVDGSVTYQATVATGAAEIPQPLTNTAEIDSDDTPPDSDTSDVFVPAEPGGETNVPTPPSTDTFGANEPGGPGASLLLMLFLLGMLVLGIGLTTPVPAVIRRRHRR